MSDNSTDKTITPSGDYFIVDPDLTYDNFVVCLNNKNVKLLRIGTGGYALLTGKDSKRIVCSIVKGQCDDNKVLLNRMVRSSLGLLVGDAVTLERLTWTMHAANRVLLVLTDQTISQSVIEDLLTEFFVERSYVLFENNTIILRGGNVKVELVVIKVLPKTYGMTHQDTLYKLQYTVPAEQKKWQSLRDLSYDDIGGQSDAFNQIRKFECVLRWPSLYKTLKPPPVRILLEGPEGSGKLLMAKTFANETGANFVCIDEQDFRNESEKENNVNNSISIIKTKFDEAISNAPSVVCFNNLQITTPSLLSTPLQKSAAADLIKFVTQLTNPSVIVIGTTTAASKIHHTLLSIFLESRNSAEIVFTVPDLYKRIEILKICTKNMTIAENSILYEIARTTEGYTAAQLAELCDMANKLRTRNARKEIIDPDVDTEFFIYRKAISSEDFKASLIKMNDRMNL